MDTFRENLNVLVADLPRETSLDEFYQAGLSAKVDGISTAEYAFPTPRPAYSVLDTSRYHSLGYAPMPDWQAALAEYFAEWRELPEEQR